jgi:hypothetical protein
MATPLHIVFQNRVWGTQDCGDRCSANSRSFAPTPWTKTCPRGPRLGLPADDFVLSGAPDAPILRMTLRWEMESGKRQNGNL